MVGVTNLLRRAGRWTSSFKKPIGFANLATQFGQPIRPANLARLKQLTGGPTLIAGKAADKYPANIDF